MNNPGTSSESAPTPAPKRRRHWKRYVLLGVFLLLVLGEIGMRVLAGTDSRFNIFLGASKQWDPYLKFRMIPNYRSGDLIINSKAILGPEFEARKPAGAYRIVTLGDSCSFVPEQRPYPRVLEEILHASHPNRLIEVINASCPGYTSQQARTWYEREIDSYDHDSLVVYLGWNDMGQYNPDGLAFKLEEGGYVKEPSLVQRVMLNCYLLRSVYLVQGYWQRSRPFSLEPLSAEEAKPYQEFYPAHFEANLRAIIELARSRGRQVHLLNFASLVIDNPTVDEQARMHFPRGMGRRLPKYLLLKHAYEKALQKVAAETKTPIIDIESKFSEPASRKVFTDSVHYTPEGSEIIAKAVAEVLDKEIK